MATLKVEKREGNGKYVAFDLRKKGLIPGIIYGKEQTPTKITINLKELQNILRDGERMLDLDVDGKIAKVMIKDVQHGTFDREILHADFKVVSEKEAIEVEIEVVLVGEAAGVAEGGMLEQNMHHITVRCLPKDLPENISIDVTNIKIGDLIHASQLPKINGVTYIIHGDPAVVSCHHPETEEAGQGDENAPTAPEVIGEKEREAKAKE